MTQRSMVMVTTVPVDMADDAPMVASIVEDSARQLAEEHDAQMVDGTITLSSSEPRCYVTNDDGTITMPSWMVGREPDLVFLVHRFDVTMNDADQA